MKRKYENLELNVEEFEVADVIMLSGKDIPDTGTDSGDGDFE